MNIKTGCLVCALACSLAALAGWFFDLDDIIVFSNVIVAGLNFYNYMEL